MKRLFAICLVASMLALPFAGCGGGDTATDEPAPTTSQDGEAPK